MSSGRHPLSQSGVRCQFPDFSSKFHRSIALEKKSVLAVGNDFADAFEVDGEYGFFAGHFVGEGVGHVEMIGLLADAHYEADVSSGQRMVELCLGWEPAGEDNTISNPQFLGKLLEVVHFGAITDQEVFEVWQIALEFGQAPENPVVAFIRMQNAVVAENDIIVAESKFMAGGFSNGFIDRVKEGMINGIPIEMHYILGHPFFRKMLLSIAYFREDERHFSPCDHINMFDPITEPVEPRVILCIYPHKKIHDRNGDVFPIKNPKDGGR